ncbi:MAG TPA: efflux RND transporter periplasmic adaptor subunit [Desulfosporosinus sp.]|nr:efflux RND transporter periplasmic adaptor subunit [Desulfosporosinus sp.]
MKNRVFWMMWVLLGIVALNGCSSVNTVETSTTHSLDGKKDSIVYLMAGRIDTNEESDITSKISARIAEINVDVGSTVKKGDILVKLDSKELEVQVVQAQAGVNTAKANLTKIQSKARPEQISQAQAALDSAQTSYENSNHTNERNQQLFNSDVISKSQLEQSQTALASAEASYKSAQEALNILNSGETSETINVFQSQLKQAQAALALAQTQLNDGTIVSPISGVVSDKNINVGELATAGVPLVTVVNPDAVIVNAYLPSALISKVKAGQETVIKVSEIPDKEFKGEISVVNSVMDSKSKNILVKVKFKDKDPLLMPGMIAEVGVRE